MDSLEYSPALFLVAGLPSLFLYGLLVHPLAVVLGRVFLTLLHRSASPFKKELSLKAVLGLPEIARERSAKTAGET